jgi:hypothetical protein
MLRFWNSGNYQGFLSITDFGFNSHDSFTKKSLVHLPFSSIKLWDSNPIEMQFSD